MPEHRPLRILFICLGNICRSPMAEYLLRDMLIDARLDQHIQVASAGTSGWHNGEGMHCGTAEILEQARIESDDFISQSVSPTALQDYDFLVVMDDENLKEMERRFGHHPQKLFKLTDLCPNIGADHVPDPYYSRRFGQTRDIISGCLKAWLPQLEALIRS